MQSIEIIPSEQSAILGSISHSVVSTFIWVFFSIVEIVVVVISVCLGEKKTSAERHEITTFLPVWRCGNKVYHSMSKKHIGLAEKSSPTEPYRHFVSITEDWPQQQQQQQQQTAK